MTNTPKEAEIELMEEELSRVTGGDGNCNVVSEATCKDTGGGHFVCTEPVVHCNAE